MNLEGKNMRFVRHKSFGLDIAEGGNRLFRKITSVLLTRRASEELP
jgi:hypothetical protein